MLLYIHKQLGFPLDQKPTKTRESGHSRQEETALTLSKKHRSIIMLIEEFHFVDRAFYIYQGELYYSLYLDNFGSCPFDSECADEQLARTHDPLDDEF